MLCTALCPIAEWWRSKAFLPANLSLINLGGFLRNRNGDLVMNHSNTKIIIEGGRDGKK